MQCINCNCNNNNNNNIISSFPSLAAFLWRSITQARNLPPHQINVFMLPVNNRSKLNPPLSEDYFENLVGIIVGGVTTTSKLLQNGLGWAALKLHQAVVNYTTRRYGSGLSFGFNVRGNDRLREVEGNNNLSALGLTISANSTPLETSSDWENLLLFGFGINGDKLSDGNMTIYSGHQPGSVDVELCLFPSYHIQSSI